MGRRLACGIATLVFVLGCTATPSPAFPTSAVASPTIAPLARTSPTPPTPTDRALPGPGYVEVDAPQVAYAGDAVAFELSGWKVGGIRIQVGIEHAVLDFGDGSYAVLERDCAGAPTALPRSHAYATAGDFQLAVSDIVPCGAVPLAGGGEPGIWILAGSPARANDWPTCSTFQLSLSARSLGTVMNQGEVVVSVRNDAATACRLDGYPRVELRRGQAALPTTLRHATSGGYQFPPIPAHLVGLEPGVSASFEIGWLGIPITDEPQEVACPAAEALRVTLPGSLEYGTAALAFAPCNGILDVTPFFPGTERVPFP